MQFLIAKLPAIAVALIVILIAGAAYLQLWPVYQHSLDPNADINMTPKNVTTKTATKPARDIAAYKLFGDPKAVKVKPAQPVKNLPKTTLKLVLRGVSAGEKPDNNSALIEGPDKKTDFYRIGDSLPGNADLDSVFPDRVVLNRNGRLENLYFPAVSKGGGPLFTSDADDDADSGLAVTSPAQPVTTRSLPSNNRTPTVVSPRTKSIKERLSSIRERIRSGQY